VTLVAVTKTIEAEIAALLPELGVTHLGESRPQELWRKAAALPSVIEWHLVGHLQRNKIDKTLPLVRWIHSVDSLRLLTALDSEAAKQQQPVSVLLEVNASGEQAKHGFAVDELVEVLPHLARLQQLHVRGLMTMAALDPDAERSRPVFRLVRELAERLRQRMPAPHRLEHLSMGMTNDFEVAIEEGATFVRLGSALFEDLPA
jgi:pyridoxal phosphate enzyme (YggS family)